MLLKKEFAIPLIYLASLIPLKADGQSLRGKVIYISSTQEVILKFRSEISNYSFTPKEAANVFKKRLTKRNISISSTTENFGVASLSILEGENSHLFILEYWDKLDPRTETVYDFSTKEKLKNELKNEKKNELKNESQIMDVAPEDTEKKLTADTAVKITSNQESPAFSPGEIDDKYSDIVTKANKAYLNQQFEEAKELYSKALELKPNHPWCISQIERIENKKNTLRIEDQQKASEATFRKHIKAGDSAFNTKSYEVAKFAYNQALGEKPIDAYAKAQLSKIDQVLKEDAYKSYVSIGKDALANQLLDNAASAFNEALKIRPNDPEAKKGLIKIDAARSAEEKNAESQRKAIEEANGKKYNFSIKQGNAAMSKSEYQVARDFFLQAQQLRPTEKLPASQLQIINTKLAEIRENEKYESFSHFGDSAFGSKDYTAALRWYDSARMVKPAATFPRKQILAVNQELLRIEEDRMRQKRTEEFNKALAEFKKADAFRIERKYEEAYNGFSDFLNKVDTLNLNQYQPSQQYYVNQAKDYVYRLERYKPQPKMDTIVNPIEADPDKKKKKKEKN